MNEHMLRHTSKRIFPLHPILRIQIWKNKINRLSNFSKVGKASGKYNYTRGDTQSKISKILILKDFWIRILNIWAFKNNTKIIRKNN